MRADPNAIALVKELDGLPLALSAAGAYLEHVTTSFSDYLRFYQASWLKLQRTSPQLGSYEDRSLYTTWQITFDRIAQRNPASAKLLKLWAYFGRQDVWFALLRHANSADDEWIQKLIEDELNFNEAITLLCSFGLVDADRSLPQESGSGGYSVHSCVYSWMTFVLNQEWDKGLARLAVTCVASNVPSTNEKDWWLLQRRLIQHAIRQEHFITDGKVDVTGLEWAFNTLGDLYYDQGKLAEAEKMYIRALQGKEEALGPDHTSTLSTVGNLGLLYKTQGKLTEAEEMFTRALRGFEKAFGQSHMLVLRAINNLGDLYLDHGKLDDARKMFQRVLQLCGQTDNPEYRSVSNAFRGLCRIYSRRRIPLWREQRTKDQADLAIQFREMTISLAIICEKQASNDSRLFSVLGRALILAERNEDAVLAFQFQSRLSQSNGENTVAWCDECGEPIRAGMERFVCTTCEDIDLCDRCHEQYKLDGFISGDSEKLCQAHPFLAVPREEVKLNYESDSLDEALKQWLTSIQHKVERREF